MALSSFLLKTSCQSKNRVIAVLAFIVSFSVVVGCDSGFEFTRRDANQSEAENGDRAGDVSGDEIDEADDDLNTRDFGEPQPDDEDLARTNPRPGEEPVPADDEDPAPGSPSDGELSACDLAEPISQVASLVPDSVRGTNVVFLLDDSGSMTNEFQKVVWEIQEFINGILASTEDNYRIVMIYDHKRAAIKNKTFYRDEAKTDRIFEANPFADQIADAKVSYIQKETWSKHSDIALFSAFGPADYLQSLPGVLPIDDPYRLTAINMEDCDSPGDFFRPRDNQSDYGVGTKACYKASGASDIRDYLLADTTVNFVAVSDDDLNVQFDRANFDFDVPAMDAYPEISDLMIRDLIEPLGAGVGYQWHSIVGPVGSQSGSGIDRDGVAHLALTKRTGGATYDIRESDWQPLFENLKEQIIFSEQKVDLACRPSTDVVVKFDGVEVDPSFYLVLAADNKVQLLPGAFDGLAPDQAIEVEVIYTPHTDS